MIDSVSEYNLYATVSNIRTQLIGMPKDTSLAGRS
jgi:hypothetical protein